MIAQEHRRRPIASAQVESRRRDGLRRKVERGLGSRILALQIIRRSLSAFGICRRRLAMKPTSLDERTQLCAIHLTFRAIESSCCWYLESFVDMDLLQLIPEVGAECKTDCLSEHDAFPRFIPLYLLARMEVPRRRALLSKGTYNPNDPP